MLIAAFVAFLVGTLLASFVPLSGMLLWGALLVFGFGLLFVRSRRDAIALACIVGALVLGAVRFSVASGPTVLQVRAGELVQLQGYVASDFKPTASGGQFAFQAVHANGEPLSERILVRTERYPEYRYGDVLSIAGELELPWPGDDFDYVSYLKKEGIRTIVRSPAIEPGLVRLGTGHRLWYEFRKALIGLRDGIADGVRASVPEPASAYLNGIILGLRQDLPQALTDAFARTGTTHVLAISGYNVAIVAYGIMFLCLRFVRRRSAVLLAVAAIGAFALLTGASASVVRAAIMGSLILVTGAWGWQLRSILLILGAACLMVLVNPFVLRHDVGFQLSFAAVAGLVYLVPVIERMLRIPKVGHWLWEILLATVAAQITTLPLILYHFGTLSPYSLPANALILPVVPFAMGIGAATSLLALLVPPVAGVIGVPAWAITQWQLGVVRFFASLPGASAQVPIPWYGMVLAYTALIAVAIRYGSVRDNGTD